MNLSDEVIEENPDLAFGNFLKFRTGTAKKDPGIVANSLKAMEDRYFVRQTLYDGIHTALDSVEDNEFKRQTLPLVEDFLKERKAFPPDARRFL